MSKEIKIILGFFIVIFLFSLSVSASSTNGTINSTYKYAWSENAGWLNFGTSEGNVTVTDSALTGYFWGENIGWISLNCSNDNSCLTVDYGVKNDGQGNLSGYAFAENVGWINFNPTYGGVTIDSSGNFLGYAWGENVGWIIFNCTTTNSCGTVDYKVKTDYLPRGARPQCNNSSDDDGDGSIDYPNDPGCSSADDNDETDLPTGGGIPSSTPGALTFPQGPIQETIPIPEVVEKISEVIENVTQKITGSIGKVPGVRKIINIFGFGKTKVEPEKIPIEKLVQKDAPLAMRGKWNLMSSGALERFVLAPLPREIRVLAQKFPELGKTFEKIGIRKITDIEKLKDAKLILPILSEMEELPVSELSKTAKQKMPTEIVFAKTAGHMINFDIVLSLTDKNRIQQRITTISGKPLQLTLKPDNPVKSIKGYVVFNSKTQALGNNNNENGGGIISNLKFSIHDLAASLIFANPVFAYQQEEPVRVEEKLVLLEFEYTDPDGDGIYTAEIQMPAVEGEYEIITVLDFVDDELGRKEIRLVTVVDPEGYVYEKDDNREIRIPEAVVSIYRLNSKTTQYLLWPADEYQQENPQITNVTGKYSFLVPEGSYYIKVESSGYLVYEGEPFQVREGSGIHTNIELKTKYWWLKAFGWKTILLIFVIILLLYNFYRDKIREKLVNKQFK